MSYMDIIMDDIRGGNIKALTKMEAIFDWHFQIHVLFENYNILMHRPLKFTSSGAIDNSALVQTIPWHQTDDKPLHESMVTIIMAP